MGKSNQAITFKGGKMTVIGNSVQEGSPAPSFKVTATDMRDLELSNFKGKTLVILSIPSVDTPVCATETKKFNELCTKLSNNVVVLAVSLDLPFAQKRWCAAEGIENVQTASDYKYRTFGENYGTYIQDLGLLARAVFVIDKNSKVSYVDYVNEIAEEPNYNAALEAVKAAA